MFDEMIKEALRADFEREIGLALEEFPLDHKFSRRHLRQMKRLFRLSEEKSSFRKRIFIAAVAVLAAAILLAGFCFFAMINGFAFRIYPDHSSVTGFDIQNPAQNMDSIYSLSEESGYELVSRDIGLSFCVTLYRKNEKQLTLTQSLPSLSFNVNTENKTVEEIAVKGCNGYFICMDGDSLLCWAMDGYVFMIEGNIDRNEAAELAELTVLP